MVSKLALGCLALVVLTAEGTSEPKKVAAPLPKKEAPEPKEEAPEPKEEAPEPKKKAPEPEKKAPEPEKEKVVTDKAKFDCDSELANWRDAWPKAKADWCCTNEKKGCEGFDCDAGVDKWEHGWSMAKIEHCCKTEGKGCKPAELEKMETCDGPAPVAWLWVGRVSCTLLGLFWGLLAGPGKLLPFHPFYSKMQPLFEKCIGPFFGLPGALLRGVIGLAEATAGIGMLLAVWGVAEKILDDAELVDVLVPMAGVGAITLGLGIAYYHIKLEGNPGAAVVSLPLAILIVVSSLIVSPLSCMLEKFQTTFYVWCGICGLCFVGSLIGQAVAGDKNFEILGKNGKAIMEGKAIVEAPNKPLE
eukprot:TRINITY_DN2912_c0_g1_i1.p1 TRINITY_DN2912_c0_g1~~TRINITY_DN2912_c0_g1_i1.p1  ORF type:complete len:359 (+),score=121.86 TRINITY_DN2912_c0_g1_i1:242-1318(+)